MTNEPLTKEKIIAEADDGGRTHYVCAPGDVRSAVEGLRDHLHSKALTVEQSEQFDAIVDYWFSVFKEEEK